MKLFATRFKVHFLALCFAFSPLILALAQSTESRIAVIPVSDSTPASINAAQGAAQKIEVVLNKYSNFEVLDSSTVAMAVGRIDGDGDTGVTWQEVASELALDYVVLLSAGPATVEYLGEQFDHLSVGELDGKPGTVYLYEGKMTLRATIRNLKTDDVLLDEEVTGSEVERYRQSYEAAKYARIVSVVRELAVIFDKTVTTGNQPGVLDTHLALINEALDDAVKKLERPIRRAFK